MNMHQMKSLKQHAQAGFTLIELVVVIVILGILAATALPRFFDLTTDARKASVAGVSGGFTTGVAMEHAKWLVDGSNIGTCVPVIGTPRTFTGCDKGATATIENVVVGYNAFGYTTSTGEPTLGPTTGLMAFAAGDTGDQLCVNIWNTVLSSGRPTIATTAAATSATTVGVEWAALAGTDAATCTFTYHGGAKAPTLRKFTYDPSTGGVVLTNA
jgi:prepilin-type N-terminal cleavage/methylation domain-containing protein